MQEYKSINIQVPTGTETSKWNRAEFQVKFSRTEQNGIEWYELYVTLQYMIATPFVG